jgi:spermidine synthase
LELVLNQNRIQLATGDVLYSDGDKYLPAIVVYQHLSKFLKNTNNVLVLGAGMGSMMHVMNANGCRPHYTLVEKDKLILKWAMEFAPEASEDWILPVCDDAAAYMQRNTTTYDFIFIDIFYGREVPDFVVSADFLIQCRSALTKGGRLALNYIADDPQRWAEVETVFAAVYPHYEVLGVNVNKILMA